MTQERKSRILIIDDNLDIHKDIKKILSPVLPPSDLESLVQDITGGGPSAESNPASSDIQIDSALQGDEGVAMVRQARLDENPYALVFVDIRIPPGLDGVQTIKQLQLEDEELQYVIITAFSDYSWEDINKEIVPKDNLLILKKPFEAIEIRQSASTLIEKWHLARERHAALDELLRSKKMEMVALMASGIAHDFNNLLMGIMGNIELAAMHLPGEHVSSKSLQTAIDVIMMAKELTHKFLLFSSFDSPNKQVTSTRDLISDAGNQVLAKSKIICDYSLPENLWLTDVDPHQVGHALREIFKNAKESMFNGGKLTVTAENISPAADHTGKETRNAVRISIQDQGCGIEEKDLPNIYDPYYSGKTRGVIKGMGLGLAIVAAIINQHEGSLHIDSIPGTGTTVTIELPASEKQLA